jgi:glycosyltransferase involved in cell wall biosynthesis
MYVSIVIPTYKRPDLLERLLTSIQKQTFVNFEVIVVDDNSPQEEKYGKVIRKYEDVFASILYLRNDENSGAPYSRNRGILQAKGELIALVDDDDEWYPQKLGKQVDLFEKGEEDLGIVYTWTEAWQGNEIKHKYMSQHEGHAIKELLKECFIPSPSVLVRKKALLDAELFDIHMPSCQDWDMWTRILAQGYKCEVVKSFETIYHKHERESIGTSSRAQKGYEMYYSKHLPLFWKYKKRDFFYLLYCGIKKKVKWVLSKLKLRKVR